jgi:gamma-glutamyl-gamma-aminobutyrate hydrolase PuuD
MSAPLIAVPAYRLPKGRITRWEQGGYAVPEKYVEGIRRAGGRPLLLTAPVDGSPEEILAPFDGLCLIGGGDIDPFLYGTEPHQEIYGLNRDRDDLELALIRHAAGIGMPVLGICRGIQIANVAFGGSLHQHLPDLGINGHGSPTAGDDAYRPVRQEVEPGSKLASALGATSLTGSCAHHQAVDSLGKGLRAVARSGDDLIEGIEKEDGWLVAVQWHPEVTAAVDPVQQALFGAFVLEAAGRS